MQKTFSVPAKGATTAVTVPVTDPYPGIEAKFQRTYVALSWAGAGLAAEFKVQRSLLYARATVFPDPGASCVKTPGAAGTTSQVNAADFSPLYWSTAADLPRP